ncbi:MAG TPA: Xaa-Pro peptidase family protein [Syntrophales bacterium]|jgi:Xaa-Pro aminopeptidase/Xaa-Pro dipeptidase|nr:Xaa-Pro peptidase family protein [Syntrophales bacterium]HON23309.1 Xaa-Pro peptidase family protein [Syntrophales bacterium]HQJ30660.1 Xaa-Pro peptidase family protein [Syntrophales bacterium]HRU88067.1 Xaa-Pro peptidase family protein [Syntrophales bacterium]
MTADEAAVKRRVDRLRQAVFPRGCDAVLLFDMKNIRYLTGFTGSDGVLLLLAERCVLLVDGRYVTQAGEQAPACEVVRYRDKIGGIAAALAAGRSRHVGFESAALTVDLHERLREQVAAVTLVPLAAELDSLRAGKDDEELARLRRAIDIATAALSAVMSLVRPGWAEREVALELDYRMRTLGSEENSFPTIVAAGPNAALPHARPGDRKLAAGEPVIIDFGAVSDGYHSDETCTFVLGPPPAELRKVYGIVKEAHDRAVAAIRAGVSCREIDAVARRHIEAQGYGDHFSHGTGHGVGLDVHEAPRLSPLSDQVLAAGMVVTVEPGIYLPGRWGVRLEDMVLVREDGAEVLTKIPKELKIIDI